MDKRYIELFTLITKTTANLAERVMDDHKEKNEEKEYAVAETMRNDYLNLLDKINNDIDNLNKADFARLLVGAILIVQNIEGRIKNEQKALQGYKVDIIPKLDQINNATPEETQKLAKELFKIQEEENI